jgi:hypothetical protein
MLVTDDRFVGLSPRGLLALIDQTQLAAAELASLGAEVEETLGAVGVDGPVALIVRSERWLRSQVPELLDRLRELDEDAAGLRMLYTPVEGGRDAPPTDPLARLLLGLTTGFPVDDIGNCDRMEDHLRDSVAVMMKRIHDLREDVWNLRFRRPTGEKSFEGHMRQLEGRQDRLRAQLDVWDDVQCGDGLHVEIAREYASRDYRIELGAEPAAASNGGGGVNVWHALGTAGKVALGAAAIAAGAAVAVEQELNPLGELL